MCAHSHAFGIELCYAVSFCYCIRGINGIFFVHAAVVMLLALVVVVLFFFFSLLLPLHGQTVNLRFFHFFCWHPIRGIFSMDATAVQLTITMITMFICVQSYSIHGIYGYETDDIYTYLKYVLVQKLCYTPFFPAHLIIAAIIIIIINGAMPIRDTTDFCFYLMPSGSRKKNVCDLSSLSPTNNALCSLNQAI